LCGGGGLLWWCLDMKDQKKNSSLLEVLFIILWLDEKFDKQFFSSNKDILKFNFLKIFYMKILFPNLKLTIILAFISLISLEGCSKYSDEVQTNLIKLQKTKACSGCDLTGIELISFDLKGADLSGANLTGANLRRSNLTGANLIETNLNDADLLGVNLTSATLININLTGVN
jgi:uncharacterized protein YjbI with pentapeptide repeats